MASSDRFPLFCCVRNCIFRVSVDRVQPFIAHLRDHFGEKPGTSIRFRCPRCETILWRFPLGETVPDEMNIRRAWNHVALIQNECRSPETQIMCIHFLVDPES
ncbi:ORF20 [Ictalurid herpesvirus 1]|uniref:Uncharacterized protein ORF20 n=1 Tax=Ictalurid herpesvirus 1 (strain Auburn) TaxID=766178 RepID=VG20_ICHVA|nr:ORF20 [Ictalurid herpesvirus 1]Q00142.1 RecName: Full=Uncharacterized protein ORF20 [Ictalurid herpesvirus 1 (strain Auburn)]AAA88123.1 ORF20 [Ictalurid herpesvirus 1]